MDPDGKLKLVELGQFWLETPDLVNSHIVHLSTFFPTIIPDVNAVKVYSFKTNTHLFKSHRCR